MKTILFIDGVTPKAYSPNQFDGCGGTEQTVVRIAEALADTQMFNVCVEQHCRTEAVNVSGFTVAYLPPNTVKEADYVVCLRNPLTLITARERFPKAKVYLWCHDMADRNLGLNLRAIIDANAKALAVSDYHRSQMIETLIPFGYTGQFSIQTIYNPLNKDLDRDGTPVDRNKLMWTASPHKGLNYAINLFNNLRNFNSDFSLYITNPGYYASEGTKVPNVIHLGSLPYSEVINHVRSSLCLFYPNISFPETFGMVMSEANAVGTPVLTHRFGAAVEVTDHPAEVIDCTNPKTVIDRVMSWYNGARPIVMANPAFKLKNVINEWITRILK